MFCDRCGATLEADQRFCGRCGKQFAVAYALPHRVHEHVRLLGILWLALSAINAIAGIILWTLANTVFAHLHEMGAPPQVPAEFVRSLFSIIGVLLLLKAAAGFAAGWGLLHHRPWARVLTVVLSFLALFHVPLGTALGIYSLWVLMPAESEREYQAIAAHAAVAG